MGCALARSVRTWAVAALLLGCVVLRLRHEVDRVTRAGVARADRLLPQPAVPPQRELPPTATDFVAQAAEPEGTSKGIAGPVSAPSTPVAPSSPKPSRSKGCAPADTACIAALLRSQLSFTGNRAKQPQTRLDFQGCFLSHCLRSQVSATAGAPPPIATASTSTSTQLHNHCQTTRHVFPGTHL